MLRSYEGINLKSKYINVKFAQIIYKYYFYDLHGDFLRRRFITIYNNAFYRVKQQDLYDGALYCNTYICVMSSRDQHLMYQLQVNEPLHFIDICTYHRSKYREYILFTPYTIAMSINNLNFTYIQQFCYVDELLQAYQLMLTIAHSWEMLEKCL